MSRIIVGLFIVLLYFSAVSQADDYRLGPGDVLQVHVWGVPELGNEVVVRPDGKITVAAIGDVSVDGLTPTELSEKLNKVLTDYVKKPISTVTVKTVKNYRVYVSGPGAESKQVALQGETTLFQLLTSLGPMESADLEESFVLRNGKRVYKNMYELMHKGKVEKDFTLKNGDIVFFPDNAAKRIYVMGRVGNEILVGYREGIKLLDVLAQAGGVDELGDKERVKILRGGESMAVNMAEIERSGNLSANVELAPGDYVIVPGTFSNMVTVTGSVGKPSNILYREGLKLLDAVLEAGGFTEFAKTSAVRLIRADGEVKKIDLSDVLEGKKMDRNLMLKPGDHVVVPESMF